MIVGNWKKSVELIAGIVLQDFKTGIAMDYDESRRGDKGPWQ